MTGTSEDIIWRRFHKDSHSRRQLYTEHDLDEEMEVHSPAAPENELGLFQAGRNWSRSRSMGALWLNVYLLMLSSPSSFAAILARRDMYYPPRIVSIE